MIKLLDYLAALGTTTLITVMKNDVVGTVVYEGLNVNITAEDERNFRDLYICEVRADNRDYMYIEVFEQKKRIWNSYFKENNMEDEVRIAIGDILELYDETNSTYSVSVCIDQIIDKGIDGTTRIVGNLVNFDDDYEPIEEDD